MKRAMIAVPLLVLLMACDDALQKVGKGLSATATAIGTLQTTVIDANKQGLVSKADAATVLTLCVKVNRAGKDATAITRAISKLDQPSAKQILAILTPVIAAVADIVNNGLAGIKDPATLAKVKGILVDIQTTLNAVQLVLVGG